MHGLDYTYTIHTFPFLLYNREDKSVPSIFVSLGSSAPAILNMVGRRSSVDASWCVRPWPPGDAGHPHFSQVEALPHRSGPALPPLSP